MRTRYGMSLGLCVLLGALTQTELGCGGGAPEIVTSSNASGGGGATGADFENGGAPGGDDADEIDTRPGLVLHAGALGVPFASGLVSLATLRLPNGTQTTFFGAVNGQGVPVAISESLTWTKRPSNGVRTYYDALGMPVLLVDLAFSMSVEITWLPWAAVFAIAGVDGEVSGSGALLRAQDGLSVGPAPARPYLDLRRGTYAAAVDRGEGETGLLLLPITDDPGDCAPPFQGSVVVGYSGVLLRSIESASSDYTGCACQVLAPEGGAADVASSELGQLGAALLADLGFDNGALVLEALAARAIAAEVAHALAPLWVGQATPSGMALSTSVAPPSGVAPSTSTPDLPNANGVQYGALWYPEPEDPRLLRGTIGEQITLGGPEIPPAVPAVTVSGWIDSGLARATGQLNESGATSLWSAAIFAPGRCVTEAAPCTLLVCPDAELGFQIPVPGCEE